MALLNNPHEIRGILEKLCSKKVAIPCFCTENTYTTEGVLFGASEFAREAGLETVYVYIAVTGNYHGREQLANYTSLNNFKEGFYAYKNDIERLAGADGPFPRVKVIPSLDHGQPDADNFLFEQGKDFWGCVMYDCSTMPLEDNRKNTAEFVRKHKNDYLIEGCVDEITESGDGGMKLTDPDDAERYLKETGVDLMVVNLGTEHRATKSELKYRGDIAREISSKVGNKLVLHGTSSLADEDLPKLASDGICKVNIWTILETQTTKVLMEKLIKNVGHILSKDEIARLVSKGWLGQKVLEYTQNESPKLSYMTELYRRNEIKTQQVARIVTKYLKEVNYSN
jgi:fructose/tagatose bisphosphate aldolase